MQSKSWLVEITLRSASQATCTYLNTMVTTRSADKRLDASRGEDLVLRSRTIGSPSSVASTPSQSQKRTASSRENTDSLRSKRVRTETNGNTSTKTTHVVVNVPVISINRENLPVPDGAVTNSASKAGAETALDNDDPEIGEDRDQATPTAKVNTVAETPDHGGETFQTPATSRHKRFDSEDPDDDTIVVNTAIDSSAPQGYHTAEEEIADSDDDEAPDVETTKVAPKLPQRRSLRTPRGKKQSASTLNITGAGNEAVGVGSDLTKNESASHTVGKESPASELGHDQALSVRKPGQETLDTNLIPSALEPSDSQTTISSQPSMNTKPSILLSGAATSASTEQGQTLSSPKTQDIGSAEDADIESVTVSDSTLQDLSFAERKSSSRSKNLTSEVSASVQDSFFPHILNRSSQLQVRNSDLTPMPKSVQLPAKATSGLSDYRRRKFQQKVAGSAGGFKMQLDWPKKRSSFVVS